MQRPADFVGHDVSSSAPPALRHQVGRVNHAGTNQRLYADGALVPEWKPVLDLLAVEGDRANSGYAIFWES